MNILHPLTHADRDVVASIWNASCGPDLAITPRFVDFNTLPATGAVQAGQIAMLGDQVAGFVLASVLPADSQTSPAEVGWIDALAVKPGLQHRGVGSTLLAWGEQWLARQGCTTARLGGSLRPFVPGYPSELNNTEYFLTRGYVEGPGGGEVWDVARDLEGHTAATLAASIEVRPARIGDVDTLLQFLWREFPNRWRFEFQEFLRLDGRISDWILLVAGRGLDGFARLTFEDSIQPIERFYPYRLPRPWGQLGPIGVSADIRGKGYGSALLDTALSHLRDRGVRGAVIDWTGLVDFYARFGFTPFRRYTLMSKLL